MASKHRMDASLRWHDRGRGFTLIELVIVVTIIGILVAIAYPSYISQMQKTGRSEGQSMLLTLSSLLESYYTENNTYVGATLAGLGVSTTTPQGYYTISITSATATAFTITATPVAGSTMATDSCGALTLTNTNVKGPSASCWQ